MRAPICRDETLSLGSNRDEICRRSRYGRGPASGPWDKPITAGTASAGPLLGQGGRAVHLQCSHGLDTLSLWRLGAPSVVGLDFSERMPPPWIVDLEYGASGVMKVFMFDKVSAQVPSFAARSTPFTSSQSVSGIPATATGMSI